MTVAELSESQLAPITHIVDLLPLAGLVCRLGCHQ